jgi:hypothetical protein
VVVVGWNQAFLHDLAKKYSYILCATCEFLSEQTVIFTISWPQLRDTGRRGGSFAATAGKVREA